VALPPGSRVGPYEVVAQIGQGGMGVVYKSHDTKLNRPAAIKILSNEFADAAARRRFQMEAQTASSLTTHTSSRCTTSVSTTARRS
jgi:serine/threonine protein kinase